MYYNVYILRRINYADKYYTEFTTNLEERLVKHNNGEVPYTSKFKPWKINTSIAFTEKEKVFVFEESFWESIR